ncbi:MAG: hypothetical protein KF768_11875 [Phycisphaeraceae bacterium]|nr:hypothetical protein [Phycisphaeraceae bacterium]
MSDEAMLSRYLGRPSSDTDSTDAESPDDCHAFGWLRGVRDRAVMLELRRKDGSITAVGYAWVERVEYNPSEGIRLLVAGQEVRIRGRNLNKEVRPSVRLFEGLTRHRVPWVREADRTTDMQSGDAETVVESIEL